MARILTLKYKDLELHVRLQKFSRDTLYGKSHVEKRGKDGIVYQHANLTMDGTHILPSKAISAHYIDPQGNYVAETLLVDPEGKAIPVVRSMFTEPVKLSKTISLEDYFSYNIDTTYILTADNIEDLIPLYLDCQALLEQHKLFRFTYVYYDTTAPRDAILVPKQGDIYVLVGEYAEPIMLSQTEILYSDIEEEELEEEIAFEVW